jgi:hypothetical protein
MWVPGTRVDPAQRHDPDSSCLRQPDPEDREEAIRSISLIRAIRKK